MAADGRPVLLDLFCHAGGATKGYQAAGFRVRGVDRDPQPNYCGDEFVQMDALDYLSTIHVACSPTCRDGFRAIHASPPCQGYSAMSSCRPGLAEQYPKLIEPVREALLEQGIPYVIENVVGAPLKNPVTLCGQMFGLRLYRHRLFECSFDVTEPLHPEHTIPATKAGHWKPETIMSVAGHVAPVAEARAAMGIDWTTRDELGEMIPPAYTQHIGQSLMAHIGAAA